MPGSGSLATLVREYLLVRAPDRPGRHAARHRRLRAGRRCATSPSTSGWAASPVYTKRIQRLLGFEGDDVETIFKGMQVDIGAPPQFMDFRYQRASTTHHGEFWLDHCGALMDVEPMGDELRRHHVPRHRGPDLRRDGHRHEPAGPDAPDPPTAARAGRPPAALPLDRDDRRGRRGAARARRRPSASPRREPRRCLSRSRPPITQGRCRWISPSSRFPASTLLALLDEIALQGHLLTLSFADAVERRSDAATAADIVRKQFTGIAGVAASRIRTAMGTDDIATVLGLHPAFHPRTYIDVDIAGPSS